MIALIFLHAFISVSAFDGVWQRNGTEYLVEAAFLGANLVDLPLLAARKRRNGAPERAFTSAFARVEPHDGQPVGFRHYFNSLGERRELVGERRGSRAAYGE